jgi:hypothetical protein
VSDIGLKKGQQLMYLPYAKSVGAPRNKEVRAVKGECLSSFLSLFPCVRNYKHKTDKRQPILLIQTALWDVTYDDRWGGKDNYPAHVLVRQGYCYRRPEGILSI